MLGDLIAALERPEVVAEVLSSLRPELAEKIAERAAQASMSVGDFSADIAMAWQYREDLAHPFSSSFATLLSIKIVLALSVLLIVFLAKAMFFISW